MEMLDPTALFTIALNPKRHQPWDKNRLCFELYIDAASVNMA